MDYDVIVIGGGIHGAGVLQAAVAKGYSALLLEQFDSAAQGTSSRSSKLIHGGLRYLEHGEFKLVYECLKERKILLRNAPSLVKLKPFYIPVYESSTRNASIIRTGLFIYSLLTGFNRKTRFSSIPKSEWGSLTGLKQTGLTAVFKYADAQTDDAALTRTVIESAQSLGAKVQWNAKFMSAERKGSGYSVHYENTSSGATIQIKAHAIVNAGGPWVNAIAKYIQPRVDTADVDLVQGAHIFLPGDTQGNIFYLEAPQDRRAVFVMPWKDHLMIGTTEKLYQGDPTNPQPSEEEINYLLEVYNHYFPGSATRDDIIGSFAGVRVLPKDSANPFKRTRETIYAYDNKQEPGYVAIYGGKLTSYRATAENVIKKLSPHLPRRVKKTDTERLSLT